MIHDGQKTFQSQVAYVSLVAVLIITALIIVIWNSPTVAAVFAALGVVWVALTLRSAIAVNDAGVKLRGFLRTRRLDWAETDAFVVIGYSGPNRQLLRSADDYLSSNSGGPAVAGISMEAVNEQALTARVRLFSVVAAVTSHGELLKVPGTASTPMDPAFPAHAAAELNRRLKQHNPTATAS